MVTGGGFYLTSGRLLNVQKAFMLFKETNNLDIGAGDKTLWISVKFIKYNNNNGRCEISFSPQSIEWYAFGATRIHFGYFGSDSNDSQNQRFWSLKYADDLILKSSKLVRLNQVTTLVLKLVLNSTDKSDEAYLFVNPGSSEPINADLEIKNVNIAFRNLVYYAGSSFEQSSVSNLKFGLNFYDIF